MEDAHATPAVEDQSTTALQQQAASTTTTIAPRQYGKRKSEWSSVGKNYQIKSGAVVVKLVDLVEHKYGPMALVKYQVCPILHSPPLTATNLLLFRTPSMSASPSRCWSTRLPMVTRC